MPALLGVCANTNALYTHVCLDCEMVCLTAEEREGSESGRVGGRRDDTVAERWALHLH